MTAHERNAQRRWRSRRLAIILLFGIAAVGLVALFLEPLRNRLAWGAVLRNEAPRMNVVEEMIAGAPDVETAIWEAWTTGRIVHRQAAINQAARLRAGGAFSSPRIEGILLAGAIDPDLNVREIALSALSSASHPELAAMAIAQLKNSDPKVRLLGLQHLKRIPGELGVPALIPLLDDPFPMVVATALNLLERWSGEDFGVKLADGVPVLDAKTGRKVVPPERRGKVDAGARRAQAWWEEHSDRFPSPLPTVPEQVRAAVIPIRAGDFSLPNLAGETVRLSDYRGRVVLINFWTTWCTACLEEIPHLIELQRKHSDLAILGISLDAVPDAHGHIGGHDGSLPNHDPDSDELDHDHHTTAVESVREKVARTAQRLGIDYPILLDWKNRAGGIFNGGELPTTVIIDPAGLVHRRFIGARDLSVFEAMIMEAARSPE